VAQLPSSGNQGPPHGKTHITKFQLHFKQLLLIISLVAATASAQQLQAVYSLAGAAHAAFCGGGAPLKGARACARLLGVPPARLHGAARRLGLDGSAAFTAEVR
jgi:hypothetical protein